MMIGFCHQVKVGKAVSSIELNYLDNVGKKAHFLLSLICLQVKPLNKTIKIKM